MLLAAFALTACGQAVGRDGDVVGNPCTEASARCAAGSVCATEHGLPDGMCSVPCTTQAECPNGSLCITEDGGRCFLRCASDADCREGYECDTEPTPAGTDARVCSRINP